MKTEVVFFDSHKDVLFKIILCGFFIVNILFDLIFISLFVFDIIEFSNNSFLLMTIVLFFSYLPCFILKNFKYAITLLSIKVLVLKWELLEIPLNQIKLIRKKSTSSYQYGFGHKRISIILKSGREINITPSIIIDFLKELQKVKTDIEIEGWKLD